MGGEASARESLWLRLVKALAHVRTDVPFAVIDAFLVVMAYMTALMLRFFDDGLVGVPPQWWEGFLKLLPVIVAVHLLANVAFGTYGHVWEYASVAEALRIVGAAVTAAATLLMGVLIWRVGLVHDGPIPVSVVVIGAMLTLAGMGLVRFRSRLFSFNRLTRGAAPRHRTLIVGTGRAAANLARYGSVDGQPITVVGFVSPSAGEANRRLAGLPVFGPLEAVPELVAVHDVDELVVATDDGDSLVRRLVDLCLLVDVRLRIIPDINKLLGGTGACPTSGTSSPSISSPGRR